MPARDALQGKAGDHRAVAPDNPHGIELGGGSEAVQRRLLDFISSGSDWFWETDADFRLRWISNEFFVLTGHRREDVYGKTRNDLGFDSVSPAVDDVAELVRKRLPIRDMIAHGIMPNGRELWTRAGAVPVFDGNGECVGYRGTTSDITELVQARRAVEDREQKFRDYANAASDWFWEVDENFNLVSISERFFSATGFRREEVIGQSRKGLGFSAVDPDVEHSIIAAVAARRPYRNALSKGVMPNGRMLWVRASAVPVFDQDGVFCGYRGTSSDVSELFEAQDAVQESEERLRDMADCSSDWLWEMGPDLTFTYISDRIEEFTGWPASHFIGRTRAAIGSSQIDGESWQAHLKTLEQRLPFRDFEFPNLKPDGSVHWVRTSGKPVFSASGRFLGYRGTSRDITAEKQAELRLREFAALVRHSHDAVISTTPDGIITSWNPAAERLYGFPAADAIGRNIAFIARSDEERKIYRQISRQVMRGDVASGFEVERRNDDGTLVVLSLTISPICDEDGAIAGLSGIVRDISESKHAEAKIASQRDELEDLNRQKDRLFSIIAHDLRSPFNVILGFSELLQECAGDFDADTVARYSAMVNSAGNTAYRLLENLLDWSRMQMGHGDFTPETIGSGDVLERNVSLLEPLAEAKGITLTWSAPEDLLMRGDPKMIDTILRNLVGNAVKFTDAGGRISVEARAGDDCVELSVADTGIGMSADHLKKLFRFSEQLSTNGTGGEKGSGLGLLLCKEMVDLHGGEIRVESAANAGTTFRIRLPADTEAAGTAARLAAAGS